MPFAVIEGYRKGELRSPHHQPSRYHGSRLSPAGAWPDPNHTIRRSSSARTRSKAVYPGSAANRTTPYFAASPVSELWKWPDSPVPGERGRLTHPNGPTTRATVDTCRFLGPVAGEYSAALRELAHRRYGRVVHVRPDPPTRHGFSLSAVLRGNTATISPIADMCPRATIGRSARKSIGGQETDPGVHFESMADAVFCIGPQSREPTSSHVDDFSSESSKNESADYRIEPAAERGQSGSPSRSILSGLC